MITGPKKLVRIAEFVAQLFDIHPTVKLRYKKRHTNGSMGKKKNHYSIHIKKSLKKYPLSLIETVAHEMVHVWQYERGDLSDVQLHTVWCGEKFSWNLTADEYYLAPWEMEARAYQDWIVYRWLKEKN